MGDALEEQFTLTNDGIIPATWVEVIDHSTLPGYPPRAQLASITTQKMCGIQTACACGEACINWAGRLCEAVTHWHWSVEIYFPEKSSLVVMPPVIPLPSMEIMPGGWMGDGVRARISLIKL